MTPMTLWLSILGALLLGAAVGGVGALVLLRRQYGDQDTVRSLQRELEAYRREVAEHYAETAKRVDNLTQAYKSVHDHLEDGAYRLVGEEELRQRLQNATSDPVTLEGIGPRELSDPRDEPKGERADPEGSHDTAPEGRSEGVSEGVGAGGPRAASAGAPETASPDETSRRRDADPPRNGPGTSANGPGNGAPPGTEAETTRRASHAETPAQPDRAGATGDEASDARSGREGHETERPRPQEGKAESDPDEPTSPREPRARN